MQIKSDDMSQRSTSRITPLAPTPSETPTKIPADSSDVQIVLNKEFNYPNWILFNTNKS